MGNDESVRCEVPYFPAAAVGLGAVFGGGLVVEGVRELYSGRLSPALLVEHGGGDTASGYHETTLRLESRGGSETFRCAHEPELAQALTRALPERVAVTEEWPALQEPSTG